MSDPQVRRPHTALLLSNGYGPDVRAEKEAHTLAAAGWRVSVIAWDRERQFPLHTRENAPELLAQMLADWPGRSSAGPGTVTVTRVPVRAAFRSGRRLLRALPRFWWGAIQALRRLRPDVVHAHDLDTLPAAVLYSRVARVPVLFDAREYYPGMVRANVGAALSAFLEGLDRALAPRVTGILTVGERLAARYRQMGGRVWIVHNTPPLPDPAWLAAQRHAYRERLSVPADALVVLYVGYLNPERLLRPVLEAVPRLEQVWLVIGGTGPGLAQVQAAAERCPRIRALGWVPLAEVQALVAASDVVYYGLDACDPNSFYFMPNLAFFAWAAERPLLTTPVGEISAVVQREGGGWVLETATGAAAAVALQRLQDATLRAELGERASAAARRTYHWGHAAAHLLEAYQTMCDVRNC